MAPYAKDSFNLAGLVTTIWQRKVFIALTVLSVVALSFVIVMVVPPRYTAETLIALNTRASSTDQVLSSKPVTLAPPLNTVLVKTELDVLTSRDLAGQVVDELDLLKDPEFNSRIPTESVLPSRLSLITQNAGEWVITQYQTLRHVLGMPLASGRSEEESYLVRSEVIDELQDRMSVKTEGESYAIRLKIEAKDPEKAAKIANTFANLYIRNQVKSRFAKVEQAQSWIAKQVADLRTQVADANIAMADFRSKSNLSATEGRDPGLIGAQQIIQLTTELALAERDRAEAEAKARQAQAIRRRNGDVTVLDFVQESPFLQEMRKEEARILAKQASLGVQYTDDAPPMRTLSDQLSRLRGEISREINTQMQRLENEVSAARAKEDTIKNRIDSIRANYRTNSKDVAELQQREREIQAKNVVLENFMARYNEIADRMEIEEPEARIVSIATPPAKPSHPKKPLLLSISFLGSLGLAISLALLFQRFRPGFLTTGEIKEALALPTLGIIPETRRIARRTTPPDYLIERPGSVYAEAVRSAQLAVLNASQGDKGAKSILITSSLPGEGKTAFSVSLGRSLSQSGHRTLLIDCDLRRPAVFRLLGIDNQPGLSDVLQGKADMQKIVHIDDLSGLHCITAGTHTYDPQKLLGSPLADKLFSDFKRDYDIVLIDSPPTMVASDPAVLAKHSNTALYIVEWDRTPRRAVQAGVEYLRSFNINVAGVVLSKVDLDRQRQYGDYVDFCFRYGEYYGN